MNKKVIIRELMQRQLDEVIVKFVIDSIVFQYKEDYEFNTYLVVEQILEDHFNELMYELTKALLESNANLKDYCATLLSTQRYTIIAKGETIRD